MADVVRTVSTVITHANGFSAGIQLQPNELVCAVQTDTNWDATTDIGVDVSQDNVTFVPVIDSTRASATSDHRFVNLPNGVAVINTLPRLSLPFVYGISFFRLRALNTGSNATAAPAADRTVIVYIAKVMGD